MAGKTGNKNAKGNKGGRPYSEENRKKAATLKGMSLDWMIEKMKGDNEEMKKEIVLKIATTCLPTETQLTGKDGKDLPVPILQNVSSNNSDKPNSGIDQKD